MNMELLPVLPGLGRHINHDPRSREFPIRTLLRSSMEIKTKTWRRGQAYDQGSTPHCVAYTGKGMLNTSPASALFAYTKRSRLSTDVIYAGAQAEDEWPGTDYDGTSGLGLMRHLNHAGYIQEYRWAFGVEDALLALSNIGPLAFGTWWKTTMWNTDDFGRLDISGTNEGGHEVELIGVNAEQRYVIGMNSWGRDWGLNGRFLLRFDDFEALLEEQGDAVMIVR